MKLHTVKKDKIEPRNTEPKLPPGAFDSKSPPKPKIERRKFHPVNHFITNHHYNININNNYTIIQNNNIITQPTHGNVPNLDLMH